jgi:hypothetical protein
LWLASLRRDLRPIQPDYRSDGSISYLSNTLPSNRYYGLKARCSWTVSDTLSVRLQPFQFTQTYSSARKPSNPSCVKPVSIQSKSIVSSPTEVCNLSGALSEHVNVRSVRHQVMHSRRTLTGHNMLMSLRNRKISLFILANFFMRSLCPMIKTQRIIGRIRNAPAAVT